MFKSLPFAPIPYCVHITSGRLLIRKKFEELNLPRHKKTIYQVKNEKNLAGGRPSGIVTRKIRQRMTRVLQTWIKAISYGQKERTDTKQLITFVTLTLPAKQIHQDKELNKALNRFLQRMKRLKAYKYYFWRAERQKNGNLHYHLIMDQYINWQLIRKEWNVILNDLGYIDLYRAEQQQKHAKGFYFDAALEQLSEGRFNQERQFKAYKDGKANNWSNPNSTDIHSLKNITNPEKYLVKYCTKISGEDQKINSRVWGCSDELKTLKEPVISEYEMNIESFCNQVEATAEKVIEDDMVKIIYSKNIRAALNDNPRIKKRVYDHYRQIYTRLYPSGYRLFGNTLFIIPDKNEKQTVRRLRTIVQEFQF